MVLGLQKRPSLKRQGLYRRLIYKYRKIESSYSKEMRQQLRNGLTDAQYRTE
jgi:hypothetical protein